MDYKLLAVDLDDTLLSNQLQLSNRVKEAVTAARNQGVVVTVATGRMYSSAKPYAQQLEIDTPLITYNGALIKEVATEQVINHHPIEVNTCQEIAQLVKEYDWHLNIYFNDKLYVNKLGREARRYQEIAGIKPLLVEDDICHFLSQPSTKLVVIGNNITETSEIAAQLEAQFGERLNITRSKPTFIEIMNENISKGRAVKNLAAQLDIKQEEVIAVGDSMNDLEMLEYAGLGVAVDNASAQLKKEADYITDSNQEDGVARVIEEFVLE
ncbi:MAG: Cof-type HAD-IIB family hydrolase [Bacillota bacterium]